MKGYDKNTVSNQTAENEQSNIKLSSLLKDVTEDYAAKEVDWGGPVGREVWPF